MHFTMEKENNGKLNFLDITVTKNLTNNNTSFTLDIYRKPTFTGLGMNFHSFTYLKYKLNNVKTLLHRALALSSSWESFHKEIEFLQGYFTTNSYPIHIFYNILNKFLDMHFAIKPTDVTRVDKLVLYFKLPFLNNPACKFLDKELRGILSKFYPQINGKFVFSNNFTIQGLLNHKEKLPTKLCSGVVYLFTCSACSATYIGQTKKSLFTRTQEHFGKSPRTGSLLARPPQSSIRDHLVSCDNNGEFLENFSILDQSNNTTLLRISESLKIHFNKPTLNNDETSYNLVTI